MGNVSRSPLSSSSIGYSDVTTVLVKRILSISYFCIAYLVDQNLFIIHSSGGQNSEWAQLSFLLGSHKYETMISAWLQSHLELGVLLKAHVVMEE